MGPGRVHVSSRKAWFAASGILVLAALARLPYLWSVPSFAVEWEEILRAATAATTHVYPATNVAHDIGPVFIYLQGFLFQVFGTNLLLPRVVALAAGALAALFAYLSGREAAGERVGLLAGGVVAFSGAAIMLSHQAFSNTLTPLAVTAAGLVTMMAERRHRYLLVPAGVLWGLALQTDTSVLAMLVPLFAYLVWRATRRGWLVPALAGIGGFVLGYANMIAYNVQTNLGSLTWILEKKKYAFSHPTGVLPVLEHYAFEAGEWGQTLGSGFLTTNLLQDAWAVVAVLACLTAYVMAVRHALREREWGSELLLALGVGPLLVIPLFNQAYNYPIAARYLLPALPFAVILIGRWLKDIWPRLKARRRRLATLAVALLAFVGPMVATIGYESGQTAAMAANAVGLGLADKAYALDPSTKAVVLFDSRGYLARWYPNILRTEGFTVYLMGDPWASGERGVFTQAAWERAITKAHSTTIAVLAPADYAALAPLVPAGARVVRQAGPGRYVIVYLPALR